MNLYFDYNATAPLCEESKQAMLEGMDVTGNASSIHQNGRRVRQKIEQAREEIADFFKASPAGVIFTSGATEANHLALCGFEGRIIVSAIEHDSVDQARTDRVVCPVNAKGVLDLEVLEDLLKEIEDPTMVCVMAANNETGIVQPIEEVSALAKKYEAVVHCDAVQAIGRVSLSWECMDLISVSAHKLGGPQGVGALIMRKEVPLKAQLRGGGQERSFRSGTENFLGILGFAAAIKKARNQNWKGIKDLRDRLEERLAKQCSEASFLTRLEPRLPNTSVIAMKGVKSATQVMSFDLAGIAISAGAACSSGRVKSSRVLRAMGVPEDLSECAIRVSMGLDCEERMVGQFLETWMKIYTQTQSQLRR
ncbi:MAG: cysteine desulfurase [Alphaproteobacteria bacterium]|nr:cysteine desulfurase [Alphaproteobacteria bacterium]